jgi:hypothetical protein
VELFSVTKVTRLKRYRRGNDASSFRISVISGENADWQGEIEHVQTGEVIQFRSVVELMLLINEMVDMLDFPQATFQIRKWSEEDELWLLELIAQ